MNNNFNQDNIRVLNNLTLFIPTAISLNALFKHVID